MHARYVFLYSVYYFYMKTKMSGFFQTVFYFGYMAMFCLGLATLCGTPLPLLLSIMRYYNYYLDN